MKKRTGKKNKTTPLILVGILGIAMLFCAAVFSFYIAKLSKIQFDYSEKAQSIDTSTVYTEDSLELPAVPENFQSKDITVPEGDVFKDKSIFNILLLGTDERTAEFSDNARADSIMILSINKTAATMKLVSLERGIGVPIPGRNNDWLTHAFRYGGADLMMQTVRECFKVDVERYVRVNFNTFSKVIDEIGGVDVTLTKAEVNYLNTYKRASYGSGADLQTAAVGVNHLNGDTALAYARMRKIDSDWKRIERQRNVVQAAVLQTKDLNLFELNRTADEVLPLIKTNLTKMEITSLLLVAPKFQGVQLEQMTIPAEGTYWGHIGADGKSLIGIDFEKNAQILQKFFYCK